MVAVLALVALMTAACGSSPPDAAPPAASGTTSTSGAANGAANGAASTTSRPPAGSAPTTDGGAPPSSSAPAPPTTRTGDNGMGEGEGNAIRKVDFANFTYPADACADTFPTPPAGGYVLRDGAATNATPADADFFAVTLNADIAYGDLTGDGNDEAALLLDCVAGNRPIVFGWVYTLAAAGPSVLHAITLDDRDRQALGATSGQLLGAQISGGRLEARWAVFAPGDPACCPTKQATLDQRWNGTTFVTEGRPRTHE